MSTKHILFPTDFSAHSFATLNSAVSFVKILDAELVLMYCKSSEEDFKQIKSASDSFERKLQELQIPYTFLNCLGTDAGESIIQESTSNPPLLLIMSTHGRHPLTKWMLGSITERVMRHTPTPTLLVSPHGSKHTSDAIKTILVGVDFSIESRQALNWAKFISQKCEGEIHVLHTIESGVLQGTPFEFPSLQNLVPNAEQTILEAFKNFDSNIAFPTLSHHHVTHGIASKEMVSLADKLAANLVVIGPHGSGGMKELLIGSTTDRIVRMSPCPVFIAKKSPVYQ